MTSKYKIAEQALRIIVGGRPNSDNVITPQEVMVFVGQALAAVGRLRFFENKAEGESHVDGQLIFTFKNQKVLKDTDTDVYYVKMPSSAVSLPHGMGVYSVAMMKSRQDVFVPTTSNFNSLYKDLRSSSLEGRPGYYVEGVRIEFVNLPSSEVMDTVLIKIVAGLEGIGDEEEIAMPLDIQGEIVQLAAQLYTKEQQAPKDNVVDNVKV